MNNIRNQRGNIGIISILILAGILGLAGGTGLGFLRSQYVPVVSDSVQTQPPMTASDSDITSDGLCIDIFNLQTNLPISEFSFEEFRTPLSTSSEIGRASLEKKLGLGEPTIVLKKNGRNFLIFYYDAEFDRQFTKFTNLIAKAQETNWEIYGSGSSVELSPIPYYLVNAPYPFVVLSPILEEPLIREPLELPVLKAALENKDQGWAQKIIADTEVNPDLALQEAQKDTELFLKSMISSRQCPYPNPGRIKTVAEMRLDAWVEHLSPQPSQSLAEALRLADYRYATSTNLADATLLQCEKYLLHSTINQLTNQELAELKEIFRAQVEEEIMKLETETEIKISGSEREEMLSAGQSNDVDWWSYHLVRYVQKRIEAQGGLLRLSADDQFMYKAGPLWASGAEIDWAYTDPSKDSCSHLPFIHTK